MTADHPVLRGTWSFPTTIWFGAGKISMLARACARSILPVGAKREGALIKPASMADSARSSSPAVLPK